MCSWLLLILFVFFRMFLRKVPLLGETQERERVLHHFISRYIQCNPSFLEGDIGIYLLLTEILKIGSTCFKECLMENEVLFKYFF